MHNMTKYAMFYVPFSFLFSISALRLRLRTDHPLVYRSFWTRRRRHLHAGVHVGRR